MLVAPKPKEELIMYLSASYGAIHVVLMTERDTVQTLVYFVSQALQAPELNYTPMKKLVLALVCAAKRLCRYFQAHPIMFITDQPIKQVISRPDLARRLQNWSIMLGEYNITYRQRTSVKGQILADFLVDKPDDAPPEASVIETLQESWTLFTDGSSCIDRSGAGLILTSPEGTELTYALRFQFTASNNEAEYEALIAGLRIAVLVEVLKEKSIQERKMATLVEEEGPTWMTPIIEYLRDETLPNNQKDASKLRIKARQYELLKGILYRRSYLKPWLRPREGKFLIVVVDYFTKWIEAKAVATISGSQVNKFVGDNIVCHFGLPEEIVTDNGKQFSGDPFKDWCEKLNIVQCFDSVKHPQSNGLVERENRSLGEGIKARLEIGMPTYRTAVVDAVHNDKELWLNLDLLKERRERAAIRKAKAKLKMTKYYNARVRGVTFRQGDFVHHSNNASHAVVGGKLGRSGRDLMRSRKNWEMEHTS
nr:reverse transcriptase domain-containing protein [Tanacetum cinerariifolium]